ncbi:hypothetical protein ABWH96_13250 [Marivirga tractuosa]|uniref:hypothetical protein n=1 Tax=Marivirga tractuosa TaxID=1006 RepID=UPI0035D0DD79
MNLKALKIHLSPFDRFIEFISSIMLIFLIGMPLFYYYKLPNEISIFTEGKLVDDFFNGFVLLWLFPIIGMVIYLGLNTINRVPFLFNTSMEQINLSGHREVIMKIKKIRIIKLLVTSAFAFVTYSITQLAIY